MITISRRTISRFITASACLIFVVWGYHDYSNGIMPYGQAAGFLIALAGLIGSSRISEMPIIQPSEKEMAARDAHNRQAMLNRVRDFWVKGVLESSLHEEARIELGLEERKGAVAERPWDVILRTPDRPDSTLPAGTKISDVFERVGRSLLILGEPGAGKTTTLLELARETIDRAEKDPTEKIPVVFNLSSWTDSKQTIANWLVEELRAKYNIPKKITISWVENDSLLLLLDGLDEVASVRRAECVKSINGFLDEHLVPVAVCCRKEEYEALNTKLKLQSAILLQPLTPEQIDGYLERLRPDLDSLREALRFDQELQEFAKTPLILSIMALAYWGISVEELQSLGSTEDRRKYLFKTYVDRMFERTIRIDPKSYPKKKIIHYLSWLARKMSENNQTVFLIESMQPSLLETKAQRRLYSILVGLIGGLIPGLMGGLIFGLMIGLIFGLMSGLIFGLMGGLIFGLIFRRKNDNKVKPAEILKWSWKEVPWGLKRGLIFGLIFGLVFELIFGRIFGLSFGSIFGLTGGLTGGLMGGLSGSEMEMRTLPNQGIKQSTKNAIIVWLMCGAIFGLIFGLMTGLVHGLSFGIFLGVFFGLIFGGIAVVQHFALRFLLSREDLLPWRLVSFLDYATERIFLRKVGGGYVFVHRMLMEYFASLEPGPEER